MTAALSHSRGPLSVGERPCDSGPALLGYARVSTEDQRLDLQRDALARAGVAAERIYEEHVSGVRTQRPELAACLKALRPGDTLVVWRLDRLGRSLVELVQLTQALEYRGIQLLSLTEHIDTTTAGGRLIFNVFAAVAQFERDIISERTRAGLKAARARGHRGGRPPKLSAKQVKLAQRLLADPAMTHGEIAALLKVSRATIYRALARAAEPDKARGFEKALRRKNEKPADE